jgi:cytidylate kinase
MAIVTISRGTFSGGTALAEAVATALGYRLVSREALVHATESYGISEAKLAAALEREPGFLDRFSYERQRYLAIIQAALCEEVASDDVVYHGLAGHLLLPNVAHVVRVRLIAPLDQRIAAAMERQGLDREKAAQYVESVDRARLRWTRHMYGREPQDCTLYDLVLSLERMDLATASALVIDAMRRPCFAATDASRAALADLTLASRVRAALAASTDTAAAIVDVTVTATAATGAVSLAGRLADPSLGEAVLATVGKVNGVKEVEHSRLFFWSYSA